MTLTELEAAGSTFLPLAISTVVRSTILACLCGCVAWLLRSRTAALRFQLWKWLLLSLFALPLLINITPRLSTPNKVITRAQAMMLTGPSAINTTPIIPPTATQPKPRPSHLWLLAIPVVYLAVSALLMARLAYNFITLRVIASRSQPIRDPAFRELVHDLWLKSGSFIKPRFAVSSDVSTPVTFDVGDTWILLPPLWCRWDEAKLRTVLAHEMAHVQRADPQTLFLALLATCLFWFHPLSWFLRRRLAALAEEACDEVVVTSECTPEKYANLLIDFARDLQSADRRIVGAIAVAGNSSMKRRIERLFLDTATLQQGRKAIAVLALAIFIPALYLTASVQPYEPREQSRPIWPNTDVSSLGADDVARIEAEVQANPENLDSRMELLVYYGRAGKQQQFTTHLLWFIQNHPTIETLSMAAMRGGDPLNDEACTQLAAAWEHAVAEHPHSVPILNNAAAFIQTTNPERAIDLFRQAEFLDAGKTQVYQGAIARIYAAAEVQMVHPEAKLNNIQMSSDTAARLRDQLLASHDPALLSQVGTALVKISRAEAADPQAALGLLLIYQAARLDPGNTKWTDALQSAKEEPRRRAAYAALMAGPPLQNGTIRIGAKIAEASLITKTDPVYPPLAIQNQIEGVVKFTVTVGTNGTVQELNLLSGHPVLVQAAKDAVLTYVYHPAKVDGQAVPFETEIAVPFRLP